MNWLTKSFNICAGPDNYSLAAALSSAVAELICTTLENLIVARLRTSSATTAKPFPASLARAASTAAFKASIFVWEDYADINEADFNPKL